MWTGNEVLTEHIVGSGSAKNFKPDTRVWWWIGIVTLIAILLWRASVVQLGRGDLLSAKANAQRVRSMVLPAPRGLIYDRNGLELATNVPLSYEVIFDEEKGLISKPISREESSKLLPSLGSNAIIEIVDREYPLGIASAHLIGYVGSITDSEFVAEKGSRCLNKPDSKGSQLGRGGIESSYDCNLKGTDGELTIEVNTSGRVARILGRREPQVGESINLTIDGQLQLVLEELMKGLRGGVVVASPYTGEIYGLGSYPSFDPRWFSLRERSDNLQQYSAQIQALFNDPDTPLMNRAISGAYPPGSLFKLVTSLAGLETANLTQNDYYTDTGVVRLGTYEFRNWYFLKYGSGEGNINVVRALARSTDTFFYDLGGRLGPELIATWARKFGMGTKSGIDLNSEVDGLIPDPEWKLREKKEKWYLGNTYHMAIGQGDVLATPIQLSRMTSVFVNGGKLCTPYLNRKLDLRCEEIVASEDNLEIVVEGMIAACSPGGTAGVFFNQPYQVACKTGTAEYGARNANGVRETHGWMTVAGPMVEEDGIWKLTEDINKAIVITVFVESGGEGSVVAAPIAKGIMDWWLEQRS